MVLGCHEMQVIFQRDIKCITQLGDIINHFWFVVPNSHEKNLGENCLDAFDLL